MVLLPAVLPQIALDRLLQLCFNLCLATHRLSFTLNYGA